MLMQTNGCSVLPHIKHIWDTSWNSRRLLEHVLSLMVDPVPAYLDPAMVSLANYFLSENYEVEGNEALVKSVFGTDCITADTYKSRLDRLPRLSQMHLNTVVMYLSDRDRFEHIVKQYVCKFAKS